MTPEEQLALQHERRDAAQKDMASGPCKRRAHRVIDPQDLVALDPERVAVLVSQLELEPNNMIVADELIIAHLSMAYKIASSMRRKLSAASKLGQGPDDLYGSAYLGLVQGVRWVQAGRLRDAGITPYLAVTVRRFVTDYCEADHLVPIERRSLKDYYDTHSGSGMAVACDPSGHMVRCRVSDGINYLETLADLRAQDCAVVDGLLAGDTHAVIAARLGVERSSVTKRVGRLYVDH